MTAALAIFAANARDTVNALVAIALAALMVGACVHGCAEELDDEHAAPAFVRGISKMPATIPTIIAGDRCDRGYAPKVDGRVVSTEPRS